MENGNKSERNEKEEEVKMEKFFALIRGFREARNRRRKELNELENKKNKKMKRAGDQGQSSWVPSFKLEDFTTEIEFIRTPLIFPGPCNNDRDDKEQAEDGALDLRLTL